ncbi:hypothetical protein SDC9_91854 [bioreactor metagenome]|uniref:Protein YhfA n=1 Tax=bioreactor metagenome TaxID=1076179 RepID=A0A644ZXL4_9ZZZZ|nr:OsmC family protein [Candidatus Pelethousia sp.]
MANLVVEIKRTNQKVHFEGVSDANPRISIPFDFAPPLGDGNGFGGLELLLMSFAGCVSTTILFLLGRSGKSIQSYTATAEGIRQEHPLCLREIRFHIRLNSEDVTGADMEKTMKQAETISPVWQAIKNTIIVETTFELL